MNRLCDLHTHSYFSDGTLSPEELICEAEKLGLSALALCDHNTAGGLERFLKAAEGKAIEAIAGIEFSVDYNGRELHLLGLFISSEHFDKIEEKMQEFRAQKEQSNIELVASLRRAGYDIDLDKIKSERAGGGYVNRAHIAAELTAVGYTASIKEAFKTLLNDGAGHYKAPRRPDVFEMIEFIRSIGAVSVLAHPFLNLNRAELAEFLPKAKKCGLVGIETIYSLYDEQTAQEAKALAEKFSLCESGGSDFHGANKPDISLGVGKGNLAIPYEFAQKLYGAK